MELSRFTDYSLRTLIYVGLHRETLATVATVAEAYEISQNHVVKVVQKLSRLGYLVTYRGRGGGMELARKPGDIVVGQVVRATENLALVDCLSADRAHCRIDGTCELRQALVGAREAFLRTLDEYTLEDLLQPRRALGRRLGVGAGD